MDNFYFWKNWIKEYKYLFFLSFVLLLLSNLFLGIVTFTNVDFLEGWGSIQDLTSIPINFQKFTDHYHEFNIEVINYLIYEKYTSTIINLNPLLGLIYTIIIFLSFTLFLTFSTTLSKYLYYVSVLLCMLFLATLNLDLLEITNGNNKNILTICIILYGGISYAIYTYFYFLNLTSRFLIFLTLNSLLILSIYFLSPLETGVIHYHLTGYSSAFFIILTAGYILYVAVENALFIVYLNSNNKRGSLMTYIFINLLYIVILVLKLFHNITFTGINEYSLFILASILTVWGTLKRNEDNKMGDTVARVMLITVIGTMAISTIAFHSANENSSLIRAFKKEIDVCFLAYAGVFFLYAMVNFIGDIKIKSNVYKFIFKPNDFTAFRMYMFGIIVSLALFAYKYQERPYYQAISGYYNAVADSYYIKGDLGLAEPFYNYAKNNDAFNNKSNVALANLAIKKGDLSKAVEYYKYATNTGGNEQAYIQLSNIYNQKGDYFDAMFTLKKGVKKHPKSYKIWNNLGILSKRSSLSDSTVFYFSKAIELAGKHDYIPLNNLITFLLKNNFKEEGKELIASIDEELHDLTTKSAIAAYNASNGIFNQWKKKPFEVDSMLTNEELAYLHNHFINNIALMDSSDLAHIEISSQTDGNIFNYEPLTFLKAFYEFYNGNPKVAQEHMATLGGGTSFHSGYYNNLLGLWLMIHKNYELANKYLTIADKYNFQGGKFNHAFVETTLGSPIVDSLWSEMGIAGKPYLNAIHNSDSITDFMKLYMTSLGNWETYEEYINSSTNKEVIILMKLERLKYFLQKENLKEATDLYSELVNLENPSLTYSLPLIEAKIALLSKDFTKAINILDQSSFPIEMKAEELYIKTKALEGLNKDNDTRKQYELLVNKFPFYEEGIIAYANYLNKKGNNTKAYEIVVQGVKALNKSIKLNKMYVLLCLEESLIEYAEETLIELEKIMPQQEFNIFEKEYRTKLMEIERKFDEWE